MNFITVKEYLLATYKSVWPFQRGEARKLMPLILIKFLVSINYQILFCLKDALVVTQSGAEIIPILKGWIVFPFAILITVIYSKLSNRLSKQALFYTMMGGFLVTLFAYAFICCPFSDILSPHASADRLESFLGPKSAHWVAAYRYWIHSLLFVTAELWGSVVILLLFWGFANDITTVDEAKKSYNIYVAAGDVATIFMGPLVISIARSLKAYPFVYTAQLMVGIAILVGLGIIATYWYAHRYILQPHHFLAGQAQQKAKKPKRKFSLTQGFSYLFTSRYLLSVAIIVIGYGLCISLVEVTWKSYLKEMHPNPADYQEFMGKITASVGVIALITSLFFGSGIIKRFGWHFSAQITPVLVGVMGVCFLSFAVFSKQLQGVLFALGMSPTMFLVVFGAAHNIGAKVSKYSFFDPTKEMAFIPLTQEEKLKGKAAIDVVGSRLGKSGSSWIQVLLFDGFGTGKITSITHLLLPIVATMSAAWIVSVHSLSKKFNAKSAEMQKAG